MKMRVLVIAGASGAGKTTVAHRLIESTGRFDEVRSLTTRPARNDKFNGEYLYADRDEFLRRVNNGELIEYMEYSSNLYGTPVCELERIVSEGKIPLLVLDLNGVSAIRERRDTIDSTVFYVYDDLNVIEKRLYTRDLAVPSAEALLSFLDRKERNINDYLSLPSLVPLFDAFIKNESVEECAKEILDVFDCRIPPQSAEEKKTIADRLSESAAVKKQ